MGKLQEAQSKLEQYGQTHLLRYYEELEPAEQERLLDQILELDFSVLQAPVVGDAKRGEITPLATLSIPEIEKSHADYERIGMEALRDGKVAAVLLAGGMGTRLGSDDPKGMYDIGITRPVYIFQRLIENLMEVTDACGRWLYLFIMTSDKNHEATTRFLKEHDYFGYDAGHIRFFRQETAPAVGLDGKILLEEKGIIASSPNGNGGWLKSMQRAGLLELVREEGIAYLNCFAVDNVLQRIADPVFVGATIAGGYDVGEKVVRKNARDEKVGVVCREDGKPSIVEYYDLTDELMDLTDENGERVYNFGVILNYLFRVEKLLSIIDAKLPLHRVTKQIRYLSEDGESVKPDAPNGCKFETLILDMIHETESCLPFEVVREREFAPIKNKTGVDSVESARALCEKNGIVL